MQVWDVLPLYPNWHAHRNALMGAAAAADDDDDDRATRTPRPGLASPASGTGLAAYPGHARLLHTLTASPPVFTYSVLFQEYVVPDSSALPLHGFTAGGAAAPGSPKHLSVSDLLAGQKQRGSVQPASLQRTPPPPVIAGGADGKLRVWDGGRFVGKIKVYTCCCRATSFHRRCRLLPVFCCPLIFVDRTCQSVGRWTRIGPKAAPRRLTRTWRLTTDASTPSPSTNAPATSSPPTGAPSPI